MNEEKAKQKEEKKEAKVSESLKKEIENLNEQLEKAKADCDHWKNSYYKAYADMDNLRKSIERDHYEAIKYRAEGFVVNLLNVLDGFHLALNSEAKSEELKNYLVGFQYVYNNLIKALEDEGVTEINPAINSNFDVNTMEAVETLYQEGEANKIVKVLFKGYKLKDHLVRPAKVVVSTNKKEEKETETPKENEDNNQNNQA